MCRCRFLRIWNVSREKFAFEICTNNRNGEKSWRKLKTLEKIVREKQQKSWRKENEKLFSTFFVFDSSELPLLMLSINFHSHFHSVQCCFRACFSFCFSPPLRQHDNDDKEDECRDRHKQKKETNSTRPKTHKTQDDVRCLRNKKRKNSVKSEDAQEKFPWKIAQLF